MPSAASEGSTGSGSPSGVSATVRSVRLSARAEAGAARRAAVARSGRALAPATRLRAAKPRAAFVVTPAAPPAASVHASRACTHTRLSLSRARSHGNTTSAPPRREWLACTRREVATVGD